MNKKIKESLYSALKIRFSIMAVFLAISGVITIPVAADEMFKGTVSAKGDILVFGGRVLDKLGRPVADASVEIWQTDGQGIYLHPGDSNTNRRDRGFQFFGTSVSDSSGHYMFRTIIPGQYEPRPRHIHVKIRHSKGVLLTSQIYFTIDGETSGVGGSNRNLRMDLERVKNSDGSAIYNGVFDFIVDTGVAGDLKLTDRQSEGPYYPLEDVSLYDNDLARVGSD